MNSRYALPIFLIMLSCNIFASSDWTQYWISGVTARQEHNFEEAEKNFNMAIELMEATGSTDHPYIYVDRSELYLQNDKNELALIDINRALYSQSMSNFERYSATWMRLMARSRLGDSIEDSDRDVRYIQDNCETKIDQTENFIIIRDLPECERFTKNLPCLFIHSGLCDSREDIRFLKTGACIINKADRCKKCDEINPPNRICDFCGQILTTTRVEDRTIEGCKSWCDLNAVAAEVWCGKTFKAPHCLALCLAAIYGLQKGCYWCCSEGNFYEKCIEPFADILSQMGQGCDPAWD